jgi:hypothetical protein
MRCQCRMLAAAVRPHGVQNTAHVKDYSSIKECGSSFDRTWKPAGGRVKGWGSLLHIRGGRTRGATFSLGPLVSGLIGRASSRVLSRPKYAGTFALLFVQCLRGRVLVPFTNSQRRLLSDVISAFFSPVNAEANSPPAHYTLDLASHQEEHLPTWMAD